MYRPGLNEAKGSSMFPLALEPPEKLLDWEGGLERNSRLVREMRPVL